MKSTHKVQLSVPSPSGLPAQVQVESFKLGIAASLAVWLMSVQPLYKLLKCEAMSEWPQ